MAVSDQTTSDAKILTKIDLLFRGEKGGGTRTLEAVACFHLSRVRLPADTPPPADGTWNPSVLTTQETFHPRLILGI